MYVKARTSLSSDIDIGSQDFSQLSQSVSANNCELIVTEVNFKC